MEPKKYNKKIRKLEINMHLYLDQKVINKL
jgi:hypothetical protein